ncbi:MAG: two-component regulator propeller domain-containing protein, partial [Myxococcota bacterium]
MLLARHLGVLLALTPSVATAAAPTWRWLTVDDGLDPEHVSALAQTPDGRLWIATQGGVFKWDGDRVQRADGGKVTDWVHDLVALPDGRVAARAEYGSLWWINGEESYLQLGPGGATEGFKDIWRNDDEELLALHQGGLYVWRDEMWILLASSGETGRASVVRQGPSGSLLLGSKRGWVKWNAGGAIPFVSGVDVAAWDARTDPDGTVWLLDQDRGIRHVTGHGELIETIPIPSQSRFMTMRDDELWWVDGNELHRLRPNAFGGRQNVSFEVPSSGPLFVDAEGSIWLGTRRGLGQLPDPSAQELTAEPGIPQLTGRTVSATATSVWLGAWQGLARHDRASGETVYIDDPVITSRVCAGADDVAWGLTTPIEGLRHRTAVGGDPPHVLGSWPAPSSSIWEDCAVASDGTVWFTQDDQLWRTNGVAEPEPFTSLPFTEKPDWLMVLRIQRGSVWVAYRQQACITQEVSLLASTKDAKWSCYALPGGGSIRDLVVTDAGNVWATGSKMGLLRLHNGAFESHPGVPTLPTAKVYALRASPRGGVWVLGPSVSMRVRDRPELPTGWQVEERLSDRLGRLVNEPSGLVEDADGTLWFGGATGLVTVPDSVRQKRVDPPAVFLADVIVDGQAMPLGDVQLPRPASHLHLRFVSPTYKAPKLLRYRMQLDDRVPTVWERDAQFDFAQLGAG